MMLPFKSADLYYDIGFDKDYHIKMPTNGFFENKRFFIQFPETVPAWSLAALLNIIKDKCGYYELVYLKSTYDGRANRLENVYRLSTDIYDVYKEEPIDACVEMLNRLHEQMI